MISKYNDSLQMICKSGVKIKLHRDNDSERWSDGNGNCLTVACCENGRNLIFPPKLYSQNGINGISELELCSFSLKAVAGVNILRCGLNMPGDPVGFYKITQDGFSPRLTNQDRSFASESADECLISANSLAAFKMGASKEITLLGNASFDKSEGTINLKYDRRTGDLNCVYKMILDGVCLKPGQVFNLDSFVIMQGEDLNLLLQDWAELGATNCGARIPADIPTGWNDWQYYRNGKTAADVLDSAEIIAELKKQGYPLDFIQVDGGFCLHLSEWTQHKPEFAPGIKELSDQIQNMGLKFGLWFAPYIQNINTSVVQEHPEWLLKTASDEALVLGASNVGQSCLIDYTVPGTEQWLREQLRRFVVDWQVRWIKLDGPNYALYRQGCLSDRSKTISEMLNRTFEIIREEAGEDVLVEGEGMMGVALGKVDLHRVQTDNHPKWYSNNNTMEPYAPRVYGKEMLLSFLHGRWWCNHRENVILRNYPSEFYHDKIANPHALEQMFTEPEFRTQLTAAVMGSGALLLTDPMRELMRDVERCHWIEKILPIYGKAAVIVDAFPDGRYPSIFKIGVSENLLIYSFTNWSERIEDFACELPRGIEFFAFSVFEQRVMGIYCNELTVAGVTAHDSRIVVLKKRETQPQLIATDLHLLPGTVDISEQTYQDNELKLEVCHFKQDDNRLFLATNDKRIAQVETNALRFSIDEFDPEYPVIRFQGRSEKTWFKIQWRD